MTEPGKIVDLNNARYDFGIDFLSGEAWCSSYTRKLWAFNPTASTLDFYGEVMPTVLPCYRAKFEDEVLQLNSSEVVTDVYKIDNGSEIRTLQGKMFFDFHAEDYEHSSPLRMKGQYLNVS